MSTIVNGFLFLLYEKITIELLKSSQKSVTFLILLFIISEPENDTSKACKWFSSERLLILTEL